MTIAERVKNQGKNAMMSDAEDRCVEIRTSCNNKVVTYAFEDGSRLVFNQNHISTRKGR